MSKFDIFLKPNGLSKIGQLRAYDNEFSTETYDKVFNTESTFGIDSYSASGVSVSEESDSLKLKYSGILAKSGAKDVYAVVGYDSNKNWKDTKCYPMHTAGNQSFELLLPIEESRNLNVAFKDNADNWDNNSGKNYVFGIR